MAGSWEGSTWIVIDSLKWRYIPGFFRCCVGRENDDARNGGVPREKSFMPATGIGYRHDMHSGWSACDIIAKSIGGGRIHFSLSGCVRSLLLRFFNIHAPKPFRGLRGNFHSRHVTVSGEDVRGHARERWSFVSMVRHRPPWRPFNGVAIRAWWLARKRRILRFSSWAIHVGRGLRFSALILNTWCVGRGPFMFSIIWVEERSENAGKCGGNSWWSPQRCWKRKVISREQKNGWEK